jgi:hypothetical protein
MGENTNLGLAILFGATMGLMMGMMALIILAQTFSATVSVDNPMYDIAPWLAWTGMLGNPTIDSGVTFDGLSQIVFTAFLGIIFFLLMVIFVILIVVGALFGFAERVLGIYMVFAAFLNATFFAVFTIGRQFIQLGFFG